MAKRRKRSKPKASHRLLYWISHLLCGVVVIFLFLTLVQCTIKKPEAPTWDTNLVIPLVNKTWDMPELIDKLDQENLITDSLGNPLFFYEKMLDTISVSGSFVISDASRTLAESLGVVQLDPFTGANIGIILSDYISLQFGAVPPISFDISEPLPPMGEFAIATVESGFAVVTLVNDFGLNLDTVIVAINDVLLSNQVASYTVPGGIPSGGVQVDTIDLSGQTISNQLEIQMHCYTPGAVPFSLAGKSLSATVSMPEGPRVSSATAQIPRITKSFSETIDLTSVHQLQAAVLDGGELVLDIENNTNVAAGLTITLTDISSGGVPLVLYHQIIPNDTQQFVHDLTGYTIEPADQVMPQSIPFEIDAVIDSSAPQLVTISAGDKISVTSSVRNVSLASVQGIIAPTAADFDSIQQNIEIPKGFDQVQLTAAVLRLEVENTVNIAGTYDITIDGDQGQQKVLSGTVMPGTPQSPVTTVIIDSAMSAFMNPVPAVLTVDGSATFGDGSTPGSINADDYIAARVILSSPLEMILDSTTFDGGWESTAIDQSNITKLTNNVNMAHVYTTVVNHLPLGVSAEILLGGDSTTLYTGPEVVLGPITVSPGTLNPDGTVATETASESVIALDAEQVHVLENDPLWIGQVFILEDTNGQPVRITGADWLSLRGYIEVDFTVTEELWED